MMLHQYFSVLVFPIFLPWHADGSMLIGNVNRSLPSTSPLLILSLISFRRSAPAWTFNKSR